MVPRHRRTYLQSERRTHVAERGERDGDGVGIIHSCRCHAESTHYAHDAIDGEECKERYALVDRHVVLTDSERQDSTRMEHLAKLIAHDFEQHDASDGLESTTGAASTASNEHADCQHYPRDMRPLSGIIVEETGGGDE